MNYDLQSQFIVVMHRLEMAGCLGWRDRGGGGGGGGARAPKFLFYLSLKEELKVCLTQHHNTTNFGYR